MMTQDQRTLIEHTDFWRKLGNEIFGIDLPPITVQFDLRGATAGQAWPLHNKIRYNLAIFTAQRDAFIARTIGHEVAHLVAYRKFGGGISPHGREWKHVMRMFKLDPSRCHSYNVPDMARRVSRPYIYKCACAEHRVTKLIHSRMVFRPRRCTQCGVRLVFDRVEQS